MPDLHYDCDIKQAYDPKADVRDPVGFVQALSIGGHALAADQKGLVDPTDGTRPLAVVAVLDGVSWAGTPTAPIQVSAVLSTENTQQLSGGPDSADVSIEFAVYSYDHALSRHFKAFFTDTPLRGSIARQGAVLSLEVSDEPQGGLEPVVFPLRLTIVPGATHAQSIQVAASADGHSAMSWGSSK